MSFTTTANRIPAGISSPSSHNPVAVLLFIASCLSASAVTYYVDSRGGSDLADGRSTDTPWQSLGRVNEAAIAPGDHVLFSRGGLWRGTLRPHSGEPGKPVRYGAYGEGGLPQLLGSVDASDPSDWTEVQPAIWAAGDFKPAPNEPAKRLFCDVGNIIFDHGNFRKYHRCGIKKWSLADCRNPGDFWYDAGTRRVFLRWPNNPAADCRSIELALRAHIVDEGGRHDVVFENLAIAYGAAHGFGGGNTARLTIRHCDIFYIGGGHQLTGPDGRPVRFGNGIEFWGSCRDNLVEDNRLWEIYDAALTNQGKGSLPNNPSAQVNITWRNNTIWNSEYSFEYWNRDATQMTDRVLFEGNLCVNAGHGWAHGQRPDPNGAHLMFYQNSAATTRFIVRNNVFCESTDVCLRMENDWRDGLVLDGNRWFQSKQPLVRWLIKDYFRSHEWKRIQDELGFEKHGSFGPLTEAERKRIPEP